MLVLGADQPNKPRTPGLDMHKMWLLQEQPITHHPIFSGDIAEAKEMFSARQKEAETTILTALRGET